MANPVNRDLYEALVAALPPRFMERMRDGIPQIYAEAYHAMHNDPLLEDAEAHYMTPHYRRALVETWMRKTGTDCGMQCSAEWNSKQTAQFSVVGFGNFLMTASYIHDRSARVRNAVFRQDLATLNQFVAQIPLFESPPAQKVRDRQAFIYCLLLHGPDADDKTKPGFIEFAFPDATKPHWIERFAFEDVYLAVQSRKTVAQPDGAVPKFKRRAEEKGGA